MKLLEEAQAWPESKDLKSVWDNLEGLRDEFSEPAATARLRERFFLAGARPVCEIDAAPVP
jgi:hypothetical protein